MDHPLYASGLLASSNIGLKIRLTVRLEWTLWPSTVGHLVMFRQKVTSELVLWFSEKLIARPWLRWWYARGSCRNIVIATVTQIFCQFMSYHDLRHMNSRLPSYGSEKGRRDIFMKAVVVNMYSMSLDAIALALGPFVMLANCFPQRA